LKAAGGLARHREAARVTSPANHSGNRVGGSTSAPGELNSAKGADAACLSGWQTSRIAEFTLDSQWVER